VSAELDREAMKEWWQREDRCSYCGRSYIGGACHETDTGYLVCPECDQKLRDLVHLT
jgi:DNA-directed RNA polymerase subunit RPC12/RpoP